MILKIIIINYRGSWLCMGTRLRFSAWKAWESRAGFPLQASQLMSREITRSENLQCQDGNEIIFFGRPHLRKNKKIKNKNSIARLLIPRKFGSEKAEKCKLVRIRSSLGRFNRFKNRSSVADSASNNWSIVSYLNNPVTSPHRILLIQLFHFGF